MTSGVHLRGTGKIQLFLTMIDYCTRWAEVTPLPNKSAFTVARAWFVRWIARFGSPRRVITDNDTPFIAQAFECLAAAFGTVKIDTTPYHPEGNAPIEAFHKTLGLGLRKIRQRYEKLMSIDEAVAWVLLGYRAQPHTGSGYSPSFLTYGTDLRIMAREECTPSVRDVLGQGRISLLAEIRNDVRLKAAKAQAALAESEEVKEPVSLEVGCKVLVQLNDRQHRALSRVLGASKLAPTWSLPMRCVFVSQNKHSGLFRCSTTGLEMEAHISRVRMLPPPMTVRLEEENQAVVLAERALMYLLVPSHRGPKLKGLGVPNDGIRAPPLRSEIEGTDEITALVDPEAVGIRDDLALPWDERVRRYWRNRMITEGCKPPPAWCPVAEEVCESRADAKKRRQAESDECVMVLQGGVLGKEEEVPAAESGIIPATREVEDSAGVGDAAGMTSGTREKSEGNGSVRSGRIITSERRRGSRSHERGDGYQ